MSPAPKKKAGGGRLPEKQQLKLHPTPLPNWPQRSAVNWILDALVYELDGDYVNARLAARRAVQLLVRRVPC